jgi:hypothetical protein
MTIFHCLAIIFMAMGATAGFEFGRARYGTTGAVLCSVAGAITGFVVGSLPGTLGVWWVRRSYRRMSLEQLHAEMSGPVWTCRHMILTELVRRSADVGRHWKRTRDMLVSANPQERIHGLACLRLGFREEARRLGTFDAMAPREEFVSRLEEAGL